MNDPSKMSNHLRELPYHDLTVASRVDEMKFTRDGGFPIGTRITILVPKDK